MPMFDCGDGELIPLDELCDGVDNCNSSSSDETSVICDSKCTKRCKYRSMPRLIYVTDRTLANQSPHTSLLESAECLLIMEHLVCHAHGQI